MYALKIKCGGKSKYVKEPFWKGWELNSGQYRFWIFAFFAKMRYRFKFPLREVEIIKNT